MIRSNPTQDYQYRVVRGDSLTNIEKQAYGSAKGILESANPQIINRPSSLEDRPTIYPGDILTIPVLADIQTLKTERAKKTLNNKQPEDLTIIIGDLEIKYDSARAVRTMDTCADGWAARIAWSPGKDKKLDALLIPNTYPDARVYIGNDLIINGALYSVAPEQTNNGLVINLEGWSYTVDLVDSTMPPFYLESNNITLKDRATQLIQQIGIKAVFDFEDTKQFDRATADRGDTIFSHLASLASQRGMLLTSTVDGNLLFTKTKTSAPVGTLESGSPLPIAWGAKFDGRLLYNSITAYGESPGNPAKEATATDPNVPRSRFYAFKADDTTDGDIQQAADWKRTKLNADALAIPFPVSGFYAPNRKRWMENTQVTIKSPEIFVPDGFTFLIRQVEYIVENSGRSTTLSIVPPTVYTGERLILPWEAA